MASTRDETPPRMLPDYREALARGRVPMVPTTAPAQLPGRNAKSLAGRWFVTLAAGMFVLILLALTLGRVGAARAILPIVLGAGGLLFFVVMWRAWGQVGRRAMAELEHGYSTLVLSEGSFWMGPGRRWSDTGHRIPWNYAGTWVLDGSTHSVVSAPDPAVDSPGYYPSPNREGVDELWTGVVWAGNYRRRES